MNVTRVSGLTRGPNREAMEQNSGRSRELLDPDFRDRRHQEEIQRRLDTTGGRRRIGIMGGTFDPIHHGHLVAASEVMDAFNLEQVLFVPAATQPFKAGRKMAPAEDRYLMTVIATASNNRFTVSRVDIDRGGITYTHETLRELSREQPDVDWFFITGADALTSILSWKNAEELFDLAHFIGVTRPGHQLNVSELPEGAVSLIEIPALAISSSDCRNRVKDGKPIWYLVPDGVVQYIEKHGLYRQSEGN